MKDGKRHGRGTMSYIIDCQGNHRSVYRGSWVNDCQDGLGSLTLNTGNVYTGTFKNNKLVGYGNKILIWMVGDHVSHILMKRFDGEFDGVRRKSGVGTFVNGWTFHCDYNEKGQPHGKGCVKDCAGNVVFESVWRNGECDNFLFDLSSGAIKIPLRIIDVLFDLIVCLLCPLAAPAAVLFSIYCLVYWAFDVKSVENSSFCSPTRGGVYTGQVQRFKPHGFGEFVSDHQNYTGEWMDGKRHGFGVSTLRNQEMFNGSWSIYQKSGSNLLTSQSMNYTGYWANDKKHGLGVATLKGQGVYNGSWEYGQRSGFGVMTWSELRNSGRGDVFVGEWLNDTFSHGTYKYSSGSLYTGGFVDNMYHGYSVLNYTDGSSYAGQFDMNWREGRGVLTSVDGIACESEWVDDEQHGEISCTGGNMSTDNNSTCGKFNKNVAACGESATKPSIKAETVVVIVVLICISPYVIGIIVSCCV